MTQDPAGAAPSTAHTDHVNAAAPTRPLVALSVNTGANGGRARSRARLVRELLDVGGVDVVEVLGATPQESIARAREILGLDPGRSAGPAGNRVANHAPDPTAGPALRKFFGTSAFHRLDPASQRALDRLRAGLARVRMEVE